MPDWKDSLKEQLLKKTSLEIDALILGLKQKIAGEKNLNTLSRLNAELRIMQDVRDVKLKESGRLVQKGPKPAAKPVLKSYDDYVKSKK